MNGMSNTRVPANQHVPYQDLPVIPLTTHELLRVAAGNPMVVRTLSGDDVLLRLPTPDEVLESHQRGVEYCERELGIPAADSPRLSREQAAILARPLVADHFRGQQ